jgi:hypothetical protein
MSSWLEVTTIADKQPLKNLKLHYFISSGSKIPLANPATRRAALTDKPSGIDREPCATAPDGAMLPGAIVL